MSYIVLILGSIIFLVFAVQRFQWAIGFLIFLFPAYLLRFQLGPFPSTVLEMAWGIIFLVWLVRYARHDLKGIVEKIKTHRSFFIALGVFFVASLLGVAVSDMVVLSLGQWRAYFLEPLLLFFILIGRSNYISSRQLTWPLFFSTLSISVYAVVQKFTGFGIATPEWTLAATRRVTAFYTSPNAVALYLAPLVFLGIAVAMKFYKQNKQTHAGVVASIVGVSLLAIAFTFSQGAWIALAVGSVVFIGLLGWRKTALTLVLLGILGGSTIVLFPERLPFHYKSAGNRVLLWQYSETFLTASPQNFVLGAGVRQFFRKVQKPYYDVKKLERLIYPHNIFLNFWTETGLFGMLSFTFLYGFLALLAYRVYRYQDKLFGAGLVTTLVVFFVHGLIDVPYFKNDLAMLFWVFAALIMVASSSNNEPMKQ